LIPAFLLGLLLAVIFGLGRGEAAPVERSPHGSSPVLAPDTPAVVLVHGAFADGSSWSKVIPILQSHGVKVVSVQNPLSSLADDVAATQRVINQQPGRVILVGHSWAGMVITQAGTGDKVAALVYVAAFAPDTGQSVNDLNKGMSPPPWAGALIADERGFLTLSAGAIDRFFAPDVIASQRAVMAVTQGPIQSAAFDEKVTQTAWRDKPVYWVLPEQDQMIDPRLQATMARQVNAKVTRLRASHVAMVSKPRGVAAVILEAARSAR
jgi:pimeloyl-ACP methyl ester carboxylesterase